LLGTGPGPNRPTVGRLNPFLDLIVRDFREFFTGVFYTRTAKYPLGRDIKSMLAFLTADMLGARETAGLTSATSRLFCIGCHLDASHIEHLDLTQWPLRTHTDHIQHARAWKDAETVQDQMKLAEQYGIRFTSLLDLEYWKVVRYVTTEPMHALGLDVIPRHVRVLLGINLSGDGGDGSEPRVE
ncbi:hypothetical protein B0H16DRAFT_1243371, partial [Mycena metata]